MNPTVPSDPPCGAGSPEKQDGGIRQRDRQSGQGDETAMPTSQPSGNMAWDTRIYRPAGLAEAERGLTDADARSYSRSRGTPYWWMASLSPSMENCLPRRVWKCRIGRRPVPVRSWSLRPVDRAAPFRSVPAPGRSPATAPHRAAAFRRRFRTIRHAARAGRARRAAPSANGSPTVPAAVPARRI